MNKTAVVALAFASTVFAEDFVKPAPLKLEERLVLRKSIPNLFEPNNSDAAKILYVNPDEKDATYSVDATLGYYFMLPHKQENAVISDHGFSIGHSRTTIAAKKTNTLNYSWSLVGKHTCNTVLLTHAFSTGLIDDRELHAKTWQTRLMFSPLPEDLGVGGGAKALFSPLVPVNVGDIAALRADFAGQLNAGMQINNATGSGSKLRGNVWRLVAEYSAQLDISKRLGTKPGSASLVVTTAFAHDLSKSGTIGGKVKDRQYYKFAVVWALNELVKLEVSRTEGENVAETKGDLQQFDVSITAKYGNRPTTAKTLLKVKNLLAQK